MKKLIIFVITFAMILALAVPAYAVTPPLQVPDMPEVPDISDDVHVELPDSAFDGYIPDIDAELTEDPTEPPAEADNCTTTWRDWLWNWYRWWTNLIH